MSEPLPGDTQWTPQARAAYAASAERLVEALRAHVATTLASTGGQRELDAHFGSAGALQSAVDAFADAEHDWCGSFPVAKGLDLAAFDQHPHDDDGGTELPGDARLAGEDVLSVLGRWDFRITDVGALLAHGRAAYRQAWPDDTDDEASASVKDVESAVAEVLHAGEVWSLEDAPGLAPILSAVQLVRHAGEQPDDDVFDDPFAITR